MAAPRKPWEKPGVNYHSISNTNGNGLTSNSIPCGPYRPNILTQIGGGGGGGSYLSTPIPGKDLPPPLPPRPYSAGQQSPSTFGYGYSPYSSFGSYPSYSSPFSYGGYGRYGFPSMSFGSYGTPDNNFIQIAEDSSRPAFQSIESIVQAVQSVSMMLESTYSALYSSFRAVIGVAHHFSHMKTQIAQIFSALALFRSLRFLCRKILYLLGIRSTNPTADQIWSSVSGTADNQCSGLSEADVKRQQSNWPIIMFFAVVFGAPWLIWKLLSSVTGMHKEVNKQWMTGQREHYMAVALFDFGAESDKELSFKAGQSIRLAPKEMQPKVRGWLLGTTDGKTSGLVPANYISILKKSDGLERQEDTASVTKSNTEHDSLLDGHSQTLPCNKELVESTVSDTESSLT